MFDKQRLTHDLNKLGISKGDVVLAKVNLGAIGLITTKKRRDYLDAILEAIGEEGTLVAFAFTKSSFIRLNKDLVFDGTNLSTAGTFPNLMLSHPKAKRSSHPTNSFVAIGKHAEEIVKDHDENSGAYEPLRKLMVLNGKFVIIGADAITPGFVTHLAEIDLGIHKRVIWPTLSKVFYRKDGELKVFKRKDIGGCSSIFYKFYGYYIKKEALIQGYVGNAYTLMMDAKTAYEIDYAILKQDPKFTLCTDLNCTRCRARRWDNLKDLPIFIIRKVWNKLKRKIRHA